MSFKTIVFIDGSDLSIALLNYLIKVKKFIIKKIIVSPNCKKKIINNLSNFQCDLIFSYYDFLIPSKIIKSLKIGGINFHPSYLPYNKGRHSAFWGIINNTEFGASSHWINDKFDAGDIFMQKKLKTKKFENAKKIYNGQINLLKKIIHQTIDLVCKNVFLRKKQNKKIKDYHFEKDIHKIVNRKLSSKISNIDFINLVRATIFNDKTGIKLIHKKKVLNVISNYYIRKKTSYKKKYYFKLSDIYKEIHKGKKYKLKVYYKKLVFIINSKIN